MQNSDSENKVNISTSKVKSEETFKTLQKKSRQISECGDIDMFLVR